MNALATGAFCVSILASVGAAAFTFSDGSRMECVAGGRTVPEVEAQPDPALPGATGQTIQDAQGYKIVWNRAKLADLPPEMRDYLFFHECAHARVPTRDEIMANCAGLKDMRAAGRAGPAVESRIAAFYGAGNGYWARTLQCANGAGAPTQPVPSPAR